MHLNLFGVNIIQAHADIVLLVDELPQPRLQPLIGYLLFPLELVGLLRPKMVVDHPGCHRGYWRQLLEQRIQLRELNLVLQVYLLEDQL